MDIHFHTHAIEQVPADAAAALLVFEGGLSGEGQDLAALNQLTGNLAGELVAAGELTGKALDVTLVHRPAGLPATRLFLVGGGTPEKFTPAVLRQAAGTLLRAAKAKGVRQLALALPEAFRDGEFVAAAVEGAVLGDWEPDALKTDPKKGDKQVTSFAVVVPGGDETLQAAADRGRILAEGQNFARDLGNEPPNRLHPVAFSERARAMAAAHGLQCDVLDEHRMRQLGMGALMGVAQGSAQPPTLTVLRYRPENTADGGPHLALVGKAVTFDTGGISIKPSENMELMKFDMCGGAAVLGAMQAIAQLKPPVAVTAFVPSTENMPSGTAQRPGDIVKTLSGKTVEVLNTDAEGRLILADAITYALREGATHLVDVATLTGAVVMALGKVNLGLFANEDPWRDRMLAAARAEGEKMWPLPLDDDYLEQLKSACADLPNIGTKGAGAITAAKFLEAFVEGKPWCHLDIAGTAWLEDNRPYLAKGPTGVTVRTMARLALDWVK